MSKSSIIFYVIWQDKGYLQVDSIVKTKTRMGRAYAPVVMKKVYDEQKKLMDDLVENTKKGVLKYLSALADARGRMYWAYLEETTPCLLNHMTMMGRLYTYLADFNEQTQDRCQFILQQMAEGEGVTEVLKRRSHWEWVKAMSSIVDRAEEIIKYVFHIETAAK